MANTTFKLRRSSVAGKAPNTSTISIGELALNLTDRKLYSSDGTNIFETGSNLTSLSVFSTLSVGNSTVNTVVNSTSLSIGSNALVNTSTLSIGNSTVNTVVNSTSISVKSIVANGGVGSANQILISNGTGIYWGVFPGGTQLIKQQYTANGSQTNFTVTGGYYSNNLQVYLNGVLLRNGIDANVESGNTFTISPAPANGSLIDVYGISTLYANGVSSVVSQQFTANGSSNTFTVTNGYLPNQILVFLNGVKQIPGTDVTITSGNTVNFVSTPANGYIVDVYGYQTSVSYYSNNLVIGNVSIGTSTISVGNSSVNTQIIAGNVFLNGSTLVVGNTAANVTVNNTVLSVGSLSINSSGTTTNTFQIGTGLYSIASGNVGIGTSSPSTKLHLHGGNFNLGGGGLNQNYIQFLSNTGGSGILVGRGYNSNNQNDLFIYDNASTALRMLIDSSGRVTKPYQPMFFAVLTSGDVSAANWIVFNSVSYNVGSHYSNSTGKFTAPVAGYYIFTSTALSTSGTSTEIAIYKNDVTIYGGGRTYGGAYSASPTGTAVIYLAANDFVRIYLVSGSVYGSGYTWFSGYLLG